MLLVEALSLMAHPDKEFLVKETPEDSLMPLGITQVLVVVALGLLV
jgi:hypothetical protein